MNNCKLNRMVQTIEAAALATAKAYCHLRVQSSNFEVPLTERSAMNASLDITYRVMGIPVEQSYDSYEECTLEELLEGIDT